MFAISRSVRSMILAVSSLCAFNRPRTPGRLTAQCLALALAICGPMQVASAQAKTATATTLAMTSGGSAVTTVASGSVVTLTASVNAGTTPVTPGQVKFCDASATYCTDIHLLGMAQLIQSGPNAGTAVMKFRPGAGSHSYMAVFLGTNTYAGSSSVVAALTVTGGATPPYPTTTMITQSGYAPDYTLTATVNGQGPVEPTGTVSFLDTSNGNTVLASASLAQWSPYLNWVNTQSPATSTDPVSVAVGDFNGDGIPDLAVASVVQANVTILLGNGDGTFNAVATQPATGNSPWFIAVGDFNGDGIPDLAVANLGSSTVSVFLGNGDGTFTAGQSVATGSYPESIAVGDFNGDGIADLAIANTDSNTLTILLGNGDGTFTAAASPATGNGPISVAAADFNGDGILDLAVANKNSDTVTILLGNGDGTFTPAVSPVTGAYPISIAAADFNRDGKPDLAVANEYSDSVTILLGNGDGTFTTQGALYAGWDPSAVGVGDFNRDGVADLVVANDESDTLSVFQGVGDGTFTAQSSSPATGGYPWSLAVADFNGDGTADVAVANQDSNDLSIFTSQNGQSGTATVYNVSPTGAGPHLVDASYPGDSNYASSTSATTSLAVLAATPVISPAPGTYTTTTSQTITITDSTPGATIYYSASGTVSTNGYVPYTGPIAVPPSSNGYEDITTYATATGYSQSSYAFGYFTITLPPVAAPTISPASGTYTTTTSQSITITDTTPGATIYYSASGTVSTGGYVPYTGAITVPATSNGYEYITAYATATGYSQSLYSYANYTITLPPVAAPTISPASGTYTTTTAQTITIADTAPGASIYYSASGAVSTSGYVLYTGPISVQPSSNGYVYIAAYATATGYSQSAYAYANYTITLPPAATPVITPASGTFSSNQTVTITDTTPGATIYYSANGPASTIGYVPYTGPITVPTSANGYENISAYAVATGYSQSNYAYAYLTFTLPPAATPVITPASGTYTTAQSIAIADSTPGATIYYQESGPIYTNGFVLYTGPIPMEGSGSLTIQAYATVTGASQSATATSTYALQLPPAATPVISLAPGEYAGTQTVTISDSTPGATIYFTTDGAYPWTYSNVYSGPITVSTSEVVTAVALVPGYGGSNDATAQYEISSSSSSFIYTIAGSDTPGYSGDGGPATFAELNGLQSVAVDSHGNVYMVDYGDNVVRKVTASTGIITTIAGTGVAGHTGDNAPAASAELWWPNALAVDAAGNLFIGETGDNVVRRIDAGTGTITTFAGNPNGTGSIGGLAANFQLYGIAGLACDRLGNLYIAENFDVLEVNAATGNIAEIAGLTNGAGFEDLDGIAVDRGQNIYVSDSAYSVVRKISPSGAVTVFAGSNNYYGGYGDGGPATQARLDYPAGLAVDGSGNVYIADNWDFAIREVNTSGIINTVAGILADPYTIAGDGSPATDVGLFYPQAIAADSAGNLFFADQYFSRIRMITVPAAPPSSAAAAPALSLAAGTYSGSQTVTMSDTTPGAEIYVSLNGNAPTTASQGYHGPIDVTGTVTIQAVALAPGYLASTPVTAAYTITTPPTAVISTVAGDGTYGLSGIGGPATSAEIGEPQAVVFDGAGNLYIADPLNYVVWMVAAGTGNITIVAGTGATGDSGDGGPATAAELSSPYGVAVDKSGNLYIADTNNGRIRMVAAQTGVIATVAGPGVSNTLGDGGPATAAYLGYPDGLAFDSAGNLYVADSTAGRIRMIAAKTGIISTVAGGGTQGQIGDGGLATAASLSYPTDVKLDGAGNLYISDEGSARIRKVVASTGIITTIAGKGTAGDNGDGGLAVNAEINPAGVAVDSAGDLYISNSPDTIRRVDANTGIITAIAGVGYFGYGGDGGSATVAEIEPQGIAFDSAGNLYIADAGNYRVRKVTFPGPAATPAFSLAAGTYVGAQTVAITDSMEGATIYYTTDGSTPTTGSSVYSGPVTVSATETLQAIAVVTGYTESAVASAAYTINQPVTPTITWSTPAAIPYGTALSATQLNASSSVAGTFVYAPAAGAVLTAGLQTLSVTFTPTDAIDYTTATSSVTLTVSKAAPTITWATPAAISYGTALSAAQLNATSSVAGSFVYTPAAGTVLTAGSQTLSVTFTPTDTTDYATATSSVTLAVNKAAPAITWATPAAIAYGTALSATQLSASSSVAGSFAYTPAAGTVLTAGSQTLSVTFTPTDATDYTTATSSVTLAVNKAAPAVGVTTSSSSITMAQALTVTVAVSGAGGALAPTGSVKLAGGSYSAQQALAAGSTTFNFAAGTLPVGSYTLTASYTPDSAGAANYTSASQTTPLTVTPPVGATTPTVTVTATTATITNQQSDTVTVLVAGASGQPTPTGSVTLASGSYNAQQTLASGSASFTIAAGALGSGANTLTASYSGDGNYGAASGTTSVTVAQAIVTVPAPASITPGASGTSTGTITAGSTYSGTLDLACSLTNSPAGAVSLPTCGLNPATVTVTSGGTATTVFTVNTTAASTTALNRPAGTNLWQFGGGGSVLVALLVFGIPSRRRRWITMVALLMAFVAVGTIGCGGHGSSSSSGSSTPATTAGNYTFTITATDSVNAKIATSTAVTVTVQ